MRGVCVLQSRFLQVRGAEARLRESRDKWEEGELELCRLLFEEAWLGREGDITGGNWGYRKVSSVLFLKLKIQERGRYNLLGGSWRREKMGLTSEVETLAFGCRNDTFQQREEWGQWCREIVYLWGGCVGKGWGMREVS